MPYAGTVEEISTKRRASYEKRKVRIRAWQREYSKRPEVMARKRTNCLKPGPARDRMLVKKREWSKRQNPADRKAYFDGRKALKSEYDRKRRESEGQKLAAQQLAWRIENQDHLNNYCRMKRATDAQYALANNQRSRINSALKDQGVKRNKRLEVLLGCTVKELMVHLENKFTDGMTWANRGKIGRVWHVDHIKACTEFDLTDPAQQAICFHYTNLQPLWSVDNIRKGGVRGKRKIAAISCAA